MAIAVPVVPGQPRRAAPAAPRPDLAQHGLELRRLAPLARRRGRREGDAVAVADEVDLGAEAVPRAAQGAIPRLVGSCFSAGLTAPTAARAARITVPSMHHSPASMSPPALSRAPKRSSRRSISPPLRIRLKRW